VIIFGTEKFVMVADVNSPDKLQDIQPYLCAAGARPTHIPSIQELKLS
jgi:hypothetical protein